MAARFSVEDVLEQLANQSDFGLSESEGSDCDDEDIASYLPEQTCDSDGETEVVADREEEEEASGALAAFLHGDFGPEDDGLQWNSF